MQSWERGKVDGDWIMRMEKVNKRLAIGNSLSGTPAECTCAVSLIQGAEEVGIAVGRGSFHLGRLPTALENY